jgi:hypothetical protein
MSTRRFATTVAVGLAAFALSGCGHTETHVALLRAPQPRESGKVELYIADQAAPARPFYDIAFVQAIGFGTKANPEDVTRALTDRGATLGCDAVVRVFIDTGYSRAHAAGVCVKWLAPGPPGPEPVLPKAPDKNPTPPPMRPAPSPRIEPLPSAPRQGR